MTCAPSIMTRNYAAAALWLMSVIIVCVQCSRSDHADTAAQTSDSIVRAIENGPPPVTHSNESPQFVSDVLHAAAGASVSAPIWLENGASAHIMWTVIGRQARYALTHPSGQSFLLADLSQERVAPDVVQYEGTVAGSPPERLIITLSSTGDHAASLEYTVEYMGGSRVIASVEPPLPAIGSPVSVQAQLCRADGTIVSDKGDCTATLVTPQGKRLELPIHPWTPSGDTEWRGVYRGVIDLDPELVGGCVILIRIQVRVGNSSIDRACAMNILISPEDSSVLQDIKALERDDDEDGLIDYLVFQVKIDIRVDSDLDFSSELRDQSGGLVKGFRRRVDRSTLALQQAIECVIPGAEIRLHGVPGILNFGPAVLVKPSSGLAPVARSAVVRTRAYDLETFEPPNGPRIFSLRPGRGPLAGGNEVEILGSGFASVGSVTINGHVLVPSFVSDTTLLVNMPPCLPPECDGTGDVVVTTRWGHARSDDAYYYVN